MSYILQTKRGGSGGDSVKTGDRGTSDIFKGVSAFNLDLSAYGAVFSGETDDQDGAKQLAGYERWPNALLGYGALCVRDSLPGLGSS